MTDINKLLDELRLLREAARAASNTMTRSAPARMTRT